MAAQVADEIHVHGGVDLDQVARDHRHEMTGVAQLERSHAAHLVLIDQAQLVVGDETQLHAILFGEANLESIRVGA